MFWMRFGFFGVVQFFVLSVRAIPESGVREVRNPDIEPENLRRQVI